MLRGFLCCFLSVPQHGRNVKTVKTAPLDPLPLPGSSQKPTGLCYQGAGLSWKTQKPFSKQHYERGESLAFPHSTIAQVM